MISFTRSARLAIIGTLAVAGLAGCSAGGAASSATSAATNPAASAASGGGTVDVALSEFAVIPSVSSIEAGTVTFTATNSGPDDPHELVVIKTDLGDRRLPVNSEGKVDEAAAGLTVIGEIEEFEPGKTGTVTLDLAPGKYVLVCNIVQDEPDGTKESHYLKGMSTEFKVP